MWYLLFLLISFSLLSNSYASECQSEDFIGSYTSCHNGLKNLIYYKNPASNCSGNANQPNNVFDILCGMFFFIIKLSILKTLLVHLDNICLLAAEVNRHVHLVLLDHFHLEEVLGLKIMNGYQIKVGLQLEINK